MNNTNPERRRNWCQAYVHAWAEQSAGQYDPHAAWDDAQAAYEADPSRNPVPVAAEHWAQSAR
jgi:hypothetical protein